MEAFGFFSKDHFNFGHDFRRQLDALFEPDDIFEKFSIWEFRGLSFRNDFLTHMLRKVKARKSSHLIVVLEDSTP